MGQKALIGKVDFHLHSYASNVTDYYAANVFSIPESYSNPIKLYHLLKRRGMSLVTLTDHNSIDGVLEMLHAGYQDVFISSEMTTTFPEDGCNLHITVANVTPAQFAEINRLRRNVYEMVDYLDQQIALEETARNAIGYFMTHPLMSTQNRPYGREGALTANHIEKALLLCNCLEVRNGARTRALNELTWDMLRELDRKTIERLANKHNIAPKGETPWLKAVVGGSDDHSGINPGETWTEFEYGGQHPTPNSLILSMRARTSAPAGAHGGPITIAHSILKLLYEGGMQGEKANTPRPVQLTGSLHALLRLVFDGDAQRLDERLRFRAKSWYHGIKRKAPRHNGKALPFEALLESEVYAMLADPVFSAELDAIQVTDERIFLVVKTLVNRMFARYLERVRHTGATNLVSAIKDVVALCTSNLFVSLPYLAAFFQQSADGRIASDVRKAFKLSESRNLVLVTDTFFDVNGVSNSIKRMLREAIRRDIPFAVATSVSAAAIARHAGEPEVAHWLATGRLKLFPSVASLDFPEYDGLQISFPPVLEFLKYLQESGFNKMQISTPGIVGLTGLLAAKMLQIDTAATYHTSIPEYVENYTKDVSLEAWAWKYMILFYHSVDEVLVPSRFVARLLHKRGLRNRKLLILDRWVDVDRFHPRKRSPSYWNKFGLDQAADLVKFVYVGRVAVEKNLHLVAQAYRALAQTRADAHLIVIGDGPYRAEFERLLEGLPVTFTGYLHGEELAVALASADVKLFPSTTDTWGNAPVEAQASGLPVVVSDIGGPAELMQDGVTGIMVRGNDLHSLLAAMHRLMDAQTRASLGAQARAFAEANRVDEPFSAVLDADAYRKRIKAHKQRADKHGPASSNAVDLREFLRDATGAEQAHGGWLDDEDAEAHAALAIGSLHTLAQRRIGNA